MRYCERCLLGRRHGEIPSSPTVNWNAVSSDVTSNHPAQISHLRGKRHKFSVLVLNIHTPSPCQVLPSSAVPNLPISSLAPILIPWRFFCISVHLFSFFFTSPPTQVPCHIPFPSSASFCCHSLNLHRDHSKLPSVFWQKSPWQKSAGSFVPHKY